LNPELFAQLQTNDTDDKAYLNRVGFVVLLSGFLKVTASEKKTGLLLIEVFRKTKLWSPGFVPWWPFLYVRDCKNSSFLSTLSNLETM
jgi:hypothetical protein